MKLECGCARWARMLQHCTWWAITCCISDVLACSLSKSLYLSPSFIFCQASGIVIERRLVPQTNATCSKASQKKKKNKNATNWEAWPGDYPAAAYLFNIFCSVLVLNPNLPQKDVKQDTLRLALLWNTLPLQITWHCESSKGWNKPPTRSVEGANFNIHIRFQGRF